MAIVYRHIRLDTNEPFYIGIGKTKKRAYSIHNRNLYWNRIVKKTSYRVEILFENISWDDAQNKEIDLIKLYGRKDLKTGILCNLTDGGENPPIMIGHKFQSGKNNSNYGKKRSAQTKKKISESLRGYVFSEERKQKISNSLKGHKAWNEGMVGLVKHSEETKLKMSNTRRNIIINEKPVYIEGMEYSSMSEAARKTGMKRLTIRARIISKNQRFQNWTFL